MNYWPGEICKKCLNRNNIGFIVSDDIWEKVVQRKYNVLCPTCFDKLAEEKEVKYVFGEVFPISWSDWLEEPPMPMRYDMKSLLEEARETLLTEEGRKMLKRDAG